MRNRTAAWWTPTGWQESPEPPAFASIPPESTDWADTLAQAGYASVTALEDIGPESYGVAVYSNDLADMHLYVELSDVMGLWTSFFVSRIDRPAFFVDKFPALSQMLRHTAIADDIAVIRTALIAYIRHGEGESTIDPHGWETLDDRRARQERQETRRQAAARKTPT